MNEKLKYQEYLQSDYWHKVSEAAKKRAGYKCQLCNSPHNLQAHHRSYEHRGNEMQHLEDVTCLCRNCHAGFHSVAETPAPVYNAAAELVLVTNENCHRLKASKEPWHWMLGAGINPKKKGWRNRAIGKRVPKSFLR